MSRHCLVLPRIGATTVLLWGLQACDRWPRFLYLDDDGEAGVPPRNLFEDEELGSARTDVQDLGALEPGGLLTLYGYAATCGYDDDSSHFEWPTWNLIGIDSDGDGDVDDYVPEGTGWFTGDIDTFRIETTAAGTFTVTLTWQNAPPSDGSIVPWDEETDLDFVVFDDAGDGYPGNTLSVTGIGSEYPPTTEEPVFTDAGASAFVVVACHHSVPADYVIEVRMAGAS